MERYDYAWLNSIDLVITYRYHRDYLNTTGEELRNIQEEMRHAGWGKFLMDQQRPDGHWGLAYYQPKWTSTHYTLFLLRVFEFPSDEPAIQKIIKKVLDELIGIEGGITPSVQYRFSECCITGMFFNVACYFHAPQEKLKPLVDYLLNQRLPDGGFNCRHPRTTVHHGSFNTTICVLEGLWEYERQGYDYRIEEVRQVRFAAEEFLLVHQLFLSDKDGSVINEQFLSMHWPYHWHYDILRALEYFCDTNASPKDKRLIPALNWLVAHRHNGKWPLSAHYPGKMHLHLEKSGKESAINTIRAFRILRHFNIEPASY